MKKITEKTWLKAEEKWSWGNCHGGACNFCERLQPDLGVLAPSQVCIDKKCLLARKRKNRVDICCNGLWSKWYYDETEENAAAVLKFIQRKHKEWKKAQK